MKAKRVSNIAVPGQLWLSTELTGPTSRIWRQPELRIQPLKFTGQEAAFAALVQLQVSAEDPQTQMSDRFGLEGWLFGRRSSLV
jgi:hypothetical protein